MFKTLYNQVATCSAKMQGQDSTSLIPDARWQVLPISVTDNKTSMTATTLMDFNVQHSIANKLKTTTTTKNYSKSYVEASGTCAAL